MSFEKILFMILLQDLYPYILKQINYRSENKRNTSKAYYIA